MSAIFNENVWTEIETDPGIPLGHPTKNKIKSLEILQGSFYQHGFTLI